MPPLHHVIVNRGVQNTKNNTSNDNVLHSSERQYRQPYKTTANEIGTGPKMPEQLHRLGRYGHSPPQVAVHVSKPLNEAYDFLSNQLNEAR